MGGVGEMAMDRSDVHLRRAYLVERPSYELGEPLSKGAGLMLALLLSIGLWALIWGVAAYSLASLLP